MASRFTHPRTATVLAAAALFSTIAYSAPDEVTADGLGEAQMCVPLRQIDDSRVIDDKTILLKMVTGPIYKRIDLAYDCSGLKDEGAFASATSISQLCQHDILRVKQEPVGSQCIVSRIVNIDEGEAKALLAGRKK
ncbi:MAG: hypothetical protein EXQ84_02350 [Rhodospirillaceae bacterium]|nr:hypothetical protein [Rhodospirillaceae bacterium]